jgi:hypothetical protein
MEYHSKHDMDDARSCGVVKMFILSTVVARYQYARKDYMPVLRTGGVSMLSCPVILKIRNTAQSTLQMRH